MTKLKKYVGEIKRFFSIFAWCLPIAWKTSKFYTIAKVLGEILTPVFASVVQVYDNRLKFESIRNLSKTTNRIIDNGIAPLNRIGTIEFEHVSFSYPGGRSRVLDDVSFTLHSDEKVALVGLNGSGKSTLIKLLLRLYDPEIGVIRINGLDIKEYKLPLLRANFSVYFQEMQNYCFSIRENLEIAVELLRNNKRYAELFRYQQEKYQVTEC